MNKKQDKSIEKPREVNLIRLMFKSLMIMIPAVLIYSYGAKAIFDLL